MKRILLYLLVVSFLGSACNPARRLADNQILLVKTNVKSNQSKYNDDLKGIIKQKPNRKMLGLFRFNLGMHNIFAKGNSRMSDWLANTVGEEPVVLDTSLTIRTSKQMELYMQNRGFFNSIVKDSTEYFGKNNNRAKVHYSITAKIPYTIKEINYSVVDTTVSKIIDNDKKNSLLKIDDYFDTKTLQEERDRITTLLKNFGFYFFNQQYITFRVDSSLSNYQVKLFLDIAPETILDTVTNTGVVIPHKAYFIKNIYVRTDFDPLRENIAPVKDTLEFNDYTFVSASDISQYNYCVMTQQIFLNQGKLFRLRDLERSYESLADLGVFKFINIELVKDSLFNSKYGYLNAFVYLTPRQKQDYSFEIEGTHSGGNFGISGNIIYRNKNTFKGAELFQIKLGGSMEATRNLVDDQTENTVLVFNTYEIGPEISLTVPKLLIPFRGCKQTNNANSFTIFSTSYNLQNRPEFRRATFKVSSGWGWKLNRFVQMRFYPAEINFVDATLTDEFEQSVIAIGDPALLDSYEDHLIPSSRFSFIYNDQTLGKSKNFKFIRLDLEASGNIVYGIDQWRNTIPNEDGKFEFLNIPYSQYVKPEGDFRYYQYLNRNNTMVYRLNGGIGIPYHNSDVLPFEKSFFGGGPNDLRAFRTRKLGPGGFNEEDKLEQTGEIKINANLEYRFDIFKLFKGAAFIDAGNIWLLNEEETKPDADFEASRFLDEIAIGTGLGLRWDFQFFIIRFDGGIKVKDPGRPKGERWVLDETKFRKVNFNIGIGYPF